jgi:hypothetical protein
MKIKNLRIKQLMKVARLMNRYPALSEAQQEVYQVVFVSKHAVAVVNGVIYDTWDSSRRFVKLVAKVSREKFAELKAKYNPEPKKEEKEMDWKKILPLAKQSRN